MRSRRPKRFWLVASAALALGFTAEWWFFRRCPEAEPRPRLVYSAAWIDAPDLRLQAGEDAGAILTLPPPRADSSLHHRPSLRAVQLESVPAVNRLILRTEFGLEEVEIAGLGGPEEWLPAAANLHLEQTGRPAMEEHLRAAGRLFEVRCAEHQNLPWLTLGGIASFHWPARAGSGRRLVHLVADPEQAEHDVGRMAVESGWTYAAPPFGRLDPLIPAALHLQDLAGQSGFHALACFDGEREALRASLAQWSALEDEELTRRGRAVAAAIAPALPGLDPEDLDFFATGEAGMRREFRRLRLLMGGGSSRDEHLQNCAEAQGVLAVSLPGGRIWVRTDDPMPIEMLDWVLGHEIIHQYQHLQEERRLEHGWPFSAYPDPLSEAHAETLNLQLQRELNPALDFAANPFVYPESVARVLEEAAALGRPVKEYLEEILRAYPEPVQGGLEDARPELMFLLHGGGSAWRGLSFAPRRGADGNLEVEVANLGDAPLVTRFTGSWMAPLRHLRKVRVVTPEERYEVDERIDSFSTSPFVLELAPRASVTIGLGRTASWMDEWTAFVGCHDPIEQHDPSGR